MIKIKNKLFVIFNFCVNIMQVSSNLRYIKLLRKKLLKKKNFIFLIRIKFEQNLMKKLKKTIKDSYNYLKNKITNQIFKLQNIKLKFCKFQNI